MAVRTPSFISFALVSVFMASTAFAEPPSGNQQGYERTNEPAERRGPPQEAFDACNDKVEDDSCEVETPRGHVISGVCKVPPRGNESLVCVPKDRLDRMKRPE